MGKRRIRLLKKLNLNFELIGVDKQENRRVEAEQFFDIKTYQNLEKAISIENPKIGLVCSSPLTHSDIILRLLKHNIHVFTEINLLSTNYEEILNESKRKKLTVFLSSTLLYRHEIDYIRGRVLKEESTLHYRYHVGQYLPDWHPWEHYKDFFVGDKRTNGCREIFAIELPWILKTFGRVTKLNVVRDQISSLNLDYPDSYIVVLEHENGNKGVFNVDIVSRKAIRQLEIYSENLHLFWDGTPDTLKEYNISKEQMENINTYHTFHKNSNYAENIIEDAYIEELKTFIGMINDEDIEPLYYLEEDIYTLDLIDQIEGNNQQ